MEWTTAAIWVLVVMLVGLGLAGMVLPVLPGSALVFAGLFLAAWVEGFEYVGAGTLSVLAVLTILTYVVDFVASSYGAKRLGASRYAMAGALAGTVVGLFFGIPGILLGPFVGAVLGELLADKDLRAASRAGIGTWLGLLLGTVAKLALGLAMIGIFIAVRFL